MTKNIQVCARLLFSELVWVVFLLSPSLPVHSSDFFCLLVTTTKDVFWDKCWCMTSGWRNAQPSPACLKASAAWKKRLHFPGWIKNYDAPWERGLGNRLVQSFVVVIVVIYSHQRHTKIGIGFWMLVIQSFSSNRWCLVVFLQLGITITTIGQHKVVHFKYWIFIVSFMNS